MQPGKNIARRLYSFALDTKLYHLIFWAVYLLGAAFIVQPGYKPAEWVTYSAIILAFHAVVVYFNNYILVNHLLFKRQYIVYILSLILTIISVTFPIAVIFHSVIHNKSIRTMVWSWEFFLLNVGSVFLTALIGMAMKLIMNWYHEEQTNRYLHRLNSETELKFLKSQINPHFLFNCLNNLYALTLKKSDLAPTTVLKLSNILRYVLYETGEGRVQLDKEVQYLRDYIELEHIRLGERVDIRFNIQGNITNKSIEPMLFLTFVENSFKHGIASQTGKGWVNIDLVVNDDRKLLFTISNSKDDTAPQRTQREKPAGGIGLDNLRKRLDLIYPGQYQLDISEQPYKYTASLQILY